MTAVHYSENQLLQIERLRDTAFQFHSVYVFKYHSRNKVRIQEMSSTIG